MSSVFSQSSGQQHPGVPGIGCLVPLWQHDMISFFNENKKEQIHFLKHMIFVTLCSEQEAFFLAANFLTAGARKVDL